MTTVKTRLLCINLVLFCSEMNFSPLPNTKCVFLGPFVRRTVMKLIFEPFFPLPHFPEEAGPIKKKHKVRGYSTFFPAMFLKMLGLIIL